MEAIFLIFQDWFYMLQSYEFSATSPTFASIFFDIFLRPNTTSPQRQIAKRQIKQSRSAWAAQIRKSHSAWAAKMLNAKCQISVKGWLLYII